MHVRAQQAYDLLQISTRLRRRSGGGDGRQVRGHLPLYRQEAIFGRAGYAIARSTLGAWVGACGVQLQPLVDALKDAILSHDVLHADETPVAMLKPGNGKTHRAYLWTYCSGAFESMKAVVYDFTETRSGKNAEAFLGAWRGKLVCDDYSGYKAIIAKGVTECGCLAHARRKFFDLHANNKSQIAEQALGYFGSRVLYPARPVAEDTGGRELPGAAPESERRKAEASTQLLGYMLGNALYEAYLKGRVTRAMLRRLFLTHVEQPGKAKEAYREIAAKVRGLGKKLPASVNLDK